MWIVMRPPRTALYSHLDEPARLEQPRDAVGAWIAADRRRDVAIRVGVAVEHPAEQAARQPQIREVDAAHERVGRPVEVERQRPASVVQHTMDLVDGRAKIGNVSQSVTGRHDVERSGRKRQREHVADQKPRGASAVRPLRLLARQLDHAPRDVESNHVPSGSRQAERDVTGPGRQIQRASAGTRGAGRYEIDEPALPSLILSVRRARP